MIMYFLVLTFCLVIKTYVIAISIHNFNTINITDLKRLLEQRSGTVLGPILHSVGKHEQSEEASEEEPHRPPPVFRDEKKNIFFDIWTIKGRENRLMGDHRGQLCVSVQASGDVQDSFNLELWRFMANVLQVRREDIEIVLSEKNEMARRVVVKARALTESECQQRLLANTRSFTLEVQEEAGAEESAKLDQLFSHTEVKSEIPTGPAPAVSEEDVSAAWRPNYVKNPTMLDKVLKDLQPNQEIVIRGRLLRKSSPNFVARPLLENYQGQKSLKVKRKILEGVHDRETERRKSFPTAPRMSCPDRIPGLSVVDTLSQDGSRVVSRRVFAPLFQNKTHDFVDELDYTEVQFQTSL